MSDGPLEETWEAWTARVAVDLDGLTDDDWITFTVHVASRASRAYAAEQAPRGWRRAGARSTRSAPPPRVPDVFVQARRLEGVIALECIGDTEFEGLTDLTRAEQDALAVLGWTRQGDGAEFSRTGDTAEDAAQLLEASLSGVLGAAGPADVDVCRAPRPPTAPAQDPHRL